MRASITSHGKKSIGDCDASIDERREEEASLLVLGSGAVGPKEYGGM
jgi:hypothetical protein